MHNAGHILSTVLQIVFIFIMLTSLFHWIRTGFRVPKYIHLLAIIASISVVYLTYGVYPPENISAYKVILLLLVVPLSIYLLYGLYGGGFVSMKVRVNDLMTLDRALNKKEAIELLTKYLGEYRKWTYENLLLLSATKHVSEITSNKGTRYRFEVMVEPHLFLVEEDTSEDDSQQEKCLAVTGFLIRLGRIYKPIGRASFIKTQRGEIIADGLENSQPPDN